MLEKLEIKNFALIENLSIDLHKGFNVITGETGSGKSIILGALNLVLGEKADPGALRAGADTLTVNAVFSVPRDHEAIFFLREHGVDFDTEGLEDTENLEVMVKRIVKSNGRSTIYIEDTMFTRSELTIFADSLIDMHGQGEHQSLLIPENQRKILDSYAENAKILEDICILSNSIEEIKLEIENTEKESADLKKNQDYLSFALSEIENVNPKVGEDEELKTKIAKSSSVQNIFEDVNYTESVLKNYKKELYNAISSLSKAVKIDESLESFKERLNSAVIETEDISESLADYLGSITFSEDLINQMQERLSSIQRLKRKYGPSLADVLSFAEKAREDIDNANGYEDKIESLKEDLSKKTKEYKELAKKLSEKRSKCATKLQKEIKDVLKGLGMPSVVFKIEVIFNAEKISANGSDTVSFLFCANPGEELKQLKNASSGGELSRVMLAVKTVLSASDSIETQVFDEVDTGIGGSVALSLASCIKRLSEKKQVIAITHLASMASRADYQFVVSKEVEGGRTYTRIKQVAGKERVREIARMLSGDTKAETIKHAEAMLKSEE